MLGEGGHLPKNRDFTQGTAAKLHLATFSGRVLGVRSLDDGFDYNSGYSSNPLAAVREVQTQYVVALDRVLNPDFQNPLCARQVSRQTSTHHPSKQSKHNGHSRSSSIEPFTLSITKMADHHHHDHGHHHHGDDHADHDHSSDVTPALQTLLYRQIDFDKIVTFNESEPGAGAAIVKKTWEQRLDALPSLDSDVDEQILMCIPFVSPPFLLYLYFEAVP